MPLGNCPRDLGGLSVLPRSHKKGVHKYPPVLGRRRDESGCRELEGRLVDCRLPGRRRAHPSQPDLAPVDGECDAGQNADFGRLSLPGCKRADAGYVPIAALFDVLDDIYPGWESTEFQYYWQKQEVRFSERDWSYYDKRDSEALELALKGDETARPALNRISFVIRGQKREGPPKRRFECWTPFLEARGSHIQRRWRPAAQD